MITRRNRFFAAGILAVFPLSSPMVLGSGFQVKELYSVNETWTPGFVQSTAPNMPAGFNGGFANSGNQTSLVQTFTPETDYNFVSVEFRYTLSEVPAIDTFLIFNLYPLTSGPDAPNIEVQGGDGLLNDSGGFSYTPTETTFFTDSNMVFALEGEGVPLEAGTTYAFEVFVDLNEFDMQTGPSTSGIGGQFYRNYEEIEGVDLLLAIYDTNILADGNPAGPDIPEPASIALWLSIGALFFTVRRRARRV
ncbi:MAG: hypothetical protein AAGJ81_15195 [Verrucomicrobiota bacterium]